MIYIVINKMIWKNLVFTKTFVLHFFSVARYFKGGNETLTPLSLLWSCRYHNPT